jgi:hypothetical protein
MGNNGSSELQTICTLPLSIKEVLNLKHLFVFKPHGSVLPLPRHYQLRHFSLWTVPMRTAVTYFEFVSYHSRRLKVVEKVHRPPERPVDTSGEPVRQ